MSSQTHLSGVNVPKKRGCIELTQKLSEQMLQLYLSDDYSDVTFIVENERLAVHRVILAARSEYFRAMLYGGLSESHQNEIHLEIPLEAFKLLLKYIYTGHMPLSMMKDEIVIDTLGLANQYGFIELELAISDYLRDILSINNVCAILDASRLYSLNMLTNVCYTFMDSHASAIIVHESFKTLSQESLIELLERDSFFAVEVEIFQAVYNWFKHNPTANVERVVARVRLPLIHLEDLLSVVRPSGILDPNHLLDAIVEKTSSKSLHYRGALFLEENVATKEFGSRTIQGEFRTALLDGNTKTSYDMEKGYTRHQINETGDQGIVVELGSINIINHIKILLWDLDTRSYSYYVDVSVTQKTWDRIIDHTQYSCRSWQYLYFPARAVRYIKLVGTHNTVNKVFHVVALEAMYTVNIPELFNGLVAPTANIATVEMSASVIEGVSRTRNDLLNGNVHDFDWDSGYTCHQLGSGVIIIQLGQPYYIGSLRLLLWDCDDRTYSFYIETSTNQKNWEMAVDKRNDQLRSWQHFTFSARPVVFLKIVGTYNTANDIFHCVHFECPSQDRTYLKQEKIRELSLEDVTSSTLVSTDKNVEKCDTTNSSNINEI